MGHMVPQDLGCHDVSSTQVTRVQSINYMILDEHYGDSTVAARAAGVLNGASRPVARDKGRQWWWP